MALSKTLRATACAAAAVTSACAETPPTPIDPARIEAPRPATPSIDPPPARPIDLTPSATDGGAPDAGADGGMLATPSSTSDGLAPPTAPPAGSTALVFREVYVGLVPGGAARTSNGHRTTWTLYRAGRSVFLKAEGQHSAATLARLDRKVDDPSRWLAPERSEYGGTASAEAPPFKVQLKRLVGAQDPAELMLDCADKSVDVHPAGATLADAARAKEGSPTPPGIWSPTRTENVRTLACAMNDDRSPTAALVFAPRRASTAKEPEAPGVEWAFVNSDMRIQEGGYRWIAKGSSPRP